MGGQVLNFEFLLFTFELQYMNAQAGLFVKQMLNPFQFKWFLFTRIPSAFFSGVRVRELERQKCTVTIPYKWFSQNPFRSTYFACLSMAAEMSTGCLAMMNVFQRTPSVSMLVVMMESHYFKKAVGKTSFICRDGDLFESKVEEAIATGEATTVTAKSVGTNEQGEVVAEFLVTWSFKVKSKK